MPRKNEMGASSREKLPTPESGEGGSSTSLRIYKEEQGELVDLTNAAESYLTRREDMLGAPDDKFQRSIVDQYNRELEEMSSRMKRLLDKMHEYRYLPPSKRWNERHQAELDAAIENATEVLDKIEKPPTDKKIRQMAQSADMQLRGNLLESMEETKHKRVELTRRLMRAKASFAGKYKVSYDRALILAEAPTGWLGRLADRLAGNKALTSKEIETAKRLKTDEAKQDMARMAATLEEADALWADIHRAEKGSITTPNVMASPETLKAVVMEDYAELPEPERKAKAEKALEEIQELDEYEDRIAEAEIAGEALTEEDRKAILPETPLSVEEQLSKKKAQEQAMLEEMVGKLENVRTPEQKTVDECVEAFGGGTEGRQAAARLWDTVQNQINLGVNEVKFTALDYVQLAAQLRRHAESGGNPETYDKTLKQLEAMNKELGFVDNPALDFGKKKANLKKFKAIGRNLARTEQARESAKVTGMEAATEGVPTRATESKETMGQPMTIEWAAALLTPEKAKEEWQSFLGLMEGDKNATTADKTRQRELAAFVIRDMITDLQHKLSDLSDLSENYARLAKYGDKAPGDPPEATLVVLLKAMDKTLPVTEDDKQAQREVRMTLGKIHEAMTHINVPTQELPKKPVGKPYEGEEELTRNIAQATAEALTEEEPATLRKEKRLKSLDAERPIVGKAIDKLANEALKIYPKNKKIPENLLGTYKKAIQRFFEAGAGRSTTEASAALKALNRKHLGKSEAADGFMTMVANMKETLLNDTSA